MLPGSGMYLRYGKRLVMLQWQKVKFLKKNNLKYFSKEHPSNFFLISRQMLKLQNAVKKSKKIGERRIGRKNKNKYVIKNFKIMFSKNEDHRNVPWLIAITLIYIFDELYALAWEL